MSFESIHIIEVAETTTHEQMRKFSFSSLESIKVAPIVGSIGTIVSVSVSDCFLYSLEELPCGQSLNSGIVGSTLCVYA